MTNAITINDVLSVLGFIKTVTSPLKARFAARRAQYEDFWALQDITFDIPAGKTFGLAGT